MAPEYADRWTELKDRAMALDGVTKVYFIMAWHRAGGGYISINTDHVSLHGSGDTGIEALDHFETRLKVEEYRQASRGT